ncbi:MAG: anthranilate phosphoribosyltransferase, partial [Gemmatimonadales bacterium]
VSPSGRTEVWEVREGRVDHWQIDPAALGLSCDDLDGLAGGGPGENAARIERLLQSGGEPVERCAVLLNAACALYVSGRGWTLGEAAERAAQALGDGAGMEALHRLRAAAPRAGSGTLNTCG